MSELQAYYISTVSADLNRFAPCPCEHTRSAWETSVGFMYRTGLTHVVAPAWFAIKAVQKEKDGVSGGRRRKSRGLPIAHPFFPSFRWLKSTCEPNI